MNRYLKSLALLVSLAVVGQTPAFANERMTDPRATPNPATYDVIEFKLKEKNLFDGRRYVTGAETIRLAVPKLVQCSRGFYGTSCTAYIRASGTSPAILNPGSPGYAAPLGFSLYQGGSSIGYVSVGAEATKPAGAIWRDNQISFRSELGGPVTFEVRESSTSTVFSFNIVTQVQSRADFDAEVAAKEAAKEAGQRAAAQAEADRVARILATKLTITCKAGSKTRKVAGDPPACPKGFTNPIASQPAFQAYSKCKLYKKTWGFARAKLQDNGKTLNIDGYGRGYSEIDFNRADWACVIKTLKVPSSVLNKIGQTRAIDGMVNATFGRMNAFWTYHPDDGLDITFSR